MFTLRNDKTFISVFCNVLYESKWIIRENSFKTKYIKRKLNLLNILTQT